MLNTNRQGSRTRHSSSRCGGGQGARELAYLERIGTGYFASLRSLENFLDRGIRDFGRMRGVGANL
jgi:hypothetical protein